MKKAIMALAAAGSLLASCTNESIAFDDFERQTIYMPYQYPVRTLSLGNDLGRLRVVIQHHQPGGVGGL